MASVLAGNSVSDGVRLHIPAKTAGQYAASAFLAAAFFLLPLAVHNGYFDIMETKFFVFLALSAPYVLLTLILCVFGHATVPFSPVAGLRAADIGILIFALSFAFGALYSDASAAALTGSLNRYQGVLSILLYALVYGCISRNFAWTRINDVALGLGFAAAGLIGILNDFGIDPLGMYRALSLNQHWQYVSTLGNTNFYSSFLGMLFPAALLFWCFAQRAVWQSAAGFMLLCGVCGMLPTGSESFMLAFLSMLWLAPLLLAYNPRTMRRYMLFLIGLAVLLGLLRLLTLALPLRQYLSLSMRTLMHPLSLFLLIASGTAGLLLLKKQKASAVNWRKAYLYGTLAIAALITAALVLINTVFSDADFGPLERFVRLNGSWGTDRGRIFKHCLDAYRSFSPIRRLFGGGPGCLYTYDLTHRLFSDAILDSAHNEYLQYLLTSGAVGLAGYLTLLIGTAAFALRRSQHRPLTAVCIACVIAYAVQASVNIAQPISTPLFFLMLSAAAGSAACRQYDDQRDQQHKQHASDDEHGANAAAEV